MLSDRLSRVLAVAVVSFMPCIPAIAQIADAEGDADIPCIDIASIDVRGDATMLTVTLTMSGRPYPPDYVIEGVDDPNAFRLCPWGLYRVPIDTDADGQPDVVLQTWFDGDGNPVTAGAPSLELDHDVAAGRITWTVLNEDLGLEELPATVMLQTATTIVPENEVQPLEPVDYEDVAPEGWQEFVVGATAAQLVGPGGGTVRVDDPGSPLDGAEWEIPAGAVPEPHAFSITARQPSVPLPSGEMPQYAFTLGPEGVQLAVPSTLRAPQPARSERENPHWALIGWNGRTWRTGTQVMPAEPQLTDRIGPDDEAAGLLIGIVVVTKILYAPVEEAWELIAAPPGSASRQRPPIVLVHGFQLEKLHNQVGFCDIGDASTFGDLPVMLVGLGYRVYSVSYDSGDDIAKKGRLLGKFLSEILADHDGYPNARIIAHSQGGLVTRAWLRYAREQSIPALVESVLTAGTPHYGANPTAIPFPGCPAREQMRPCGRFLEGTDLSRLGLNEFDRVYGSPDLACCATDFVVLAAEHDAVVDRDSAMALRCEDLAALDPQIDPYNTERPTCAHPYRMEVVDDPNSPTAQWRHFPACYDYRDQFVVTYTPKLPEPWEWQEPVADILPGAKRSLVPGTDHTSEDPYLPIIRFDLSDWSRSYMHPSWPHVKAFVMQDCGGVGRPVAHWPLDGDARDVAGGGHHGVVVNAVPTEDRFGSPNGAFRFDGDGDYIDISEDIDQGTGDLTWSAWFQQEDPPRFRAILSKKEPKQSRFDSLQLFGSCYDAGVPCFEICDGDQNVCDAAVAPRRYDDGRWHHIAGVRDGKSVKLYLDGMLAGSVASSGLDADGADGIKIGAAGDLGAGCNKPGCTDDSFLGSIDDVRIYDRALTPQEISCLYAPGTDVDGDGWCGEGAGDPYADRVVESSPALNASASDPSQPVPGDPGRVLGPQDGRMVNFDDMDGEPGFVVVAFTDNVALDGVGDDIAIHLVDFCEVGREEFSAYVSEDGEAWSFMGRFVPNPGDCERPSTRSFDLAGSGLARVRYVKVVNETYDPASPWEGPDLDAFEALNSE